MKKGDFNRDWTFVNKTTKEKRKINLPYDAMIHEKRQPDCKNGKNTGYFPGGTYLYSKKFDAPWEWDGKYIVLEFEGVYQNATVFLNGEKLTFHPYGYTGFSVDLTEKLKYGEENEICVEADNKGEPCSRWYCGSGIYRPVWLYVGEKEHIEVDGIRIRTIQAEPAKIHLDVVCTTEEVVAEIFDTKSGTEKKVAEGKGTSCEILIPDADLWSCETPNLYLCRVSVYKDGVMKDTMDQTFGICKITWGTRGLFINGHETKLRGACIHHDNGVLGACEYPAAAERRVKILKEAGYNAVRMAHHPMSKAMLNACDKYGLYVMDEFSDMWYEHKTRYDYASYFMEWHQADLTYMVQKDICHPSVIMYSIGNEVTETSQATGIKLTGSMSQLVRELDDSRPVTCGINMSLNVMNFAGMGVYQPEPGEPVVDKGPKNQKAMVFLKQVMAGMSSHGKDNPMDTASGQDDGKKDGKLVGSEYFNQMMIQMKEMQNQVVTQEVAKVLSEDAYEKLDIAGYNYATARYEMDAKDYPNRVSVGSETLPQKIYTNWQKVKKLPYIIGDFMWTGWDYIGEAGIGAFVYDSVGSKNKEYPFLLAGCGVIDILGHPRPEIWLNKSVFELTKKPYISVEPVTHSHENHLIGAWRFSDGVHSWSWEGCEGKKAEIIVYSSEKEVELFQNGASLGRKPVSECQVKFETVYEQGSLVAVSYDANGVETGRDELHTAEESDRLTLTADKRNLSADGQDLCYIDIDLTDDKGTIKSGKDCRISLQVKGVGSLAGLGNAAPCTEEDYVSDNTVTYYGRAQAAIRSGYEKGCIRVTVSAEGYRDQQIEITVE